ncbi:MAG: hypothetical protein GF344_05365 [Chitinivibrionales bacterium]|nr:hypothetical protein [Chitinivibrionales bacterium]
MKLVEPNTIYIEASALGRPYDDQSVLRNQMETTALVMIITLVKKGKYTLYYSPIHLIEIERNSIEAEKIEILRFLYSYGKNIGEIVNYDAVERRAFELVEHRVGYADALHLANAEALDVNFITCDDGLLRKCRTCGTHVWYGTTIDFCKKEGLI